MIPVPELAEYIQAPGVPLPDQTKDGREIVGENDETEPTAVDQSCRLEYFIVLLDLVACGKRPWVPPRPTLIDLQEFLGDVLDRMKDGSGWKGLRWTMEEDIRCDCD